MIIPATIALLFAFTLYYVLFLTFVQSGLKKLSLVPPLNETTMSASVIVAARNEEGTIEKCVRAIMNQQYAAERYELIVVSDGSTDRTESIVAGLAATNPRIRLLTLSADHSRVSHGKPSAISAGVEAAKGEVILTTDADCIVPPTWIQDMLQSMQADVAFAAGVVYERPERTLLSKLAHLEFLGLVTTAAGLIGSRHPIICNGANLAFRRSSFLAAQGYGESRTWCDDETLMHRIQKRHLGEIVFVPSPGARVETDPARSLVTFWKQRLRWSAQGNHFEGASTLLTVVGLYFFFVLLLLSFVGSFFDVQICICFLIAIAAKIALDYSTLRKGARLFHDRLPVFIFLAAELFHVPYVVITAGLGQFSSFSWKGRRITP